MIGPGAAAVENIRVDGSENVALPLHQIAAGAGTIWVLTAGNNVIRIDPETRRITHRIPLGPAVGDAESIAVGPTSVWVTENSAFAIAQISPRTNRIVGESVECGSPLNT